MDKQMIIEKLVKDNDYKAMCDQIAGSYADDLYQELVLVILEMPEEKLQHLNNTCLKCFFYRMAQLQFQSKNSAFYRKYLRENELIKKKGRDIQLVNDSCFDAELMDKVDAVMKEMYWYDADVLKLYAELGTVREVSEETGIPSRSIYNTVTTTKKLIKKKINKYE
jgi:hypothetical protein